MFFEAPQSCFGGILSSRKLLFSIPKKLVARNRVRHSVSGKALLGDIVSGRSQNHDLTSVTADQNNSGEPEIMSKVMF